MPVPKLCMSDQQLASEHMVELLLALQLAQDSRLAIAVVQWSVKYGPPPRPAKVPFSLETLQLQARGPSVFLSAGLDDEDLWAGLDFEDPLMAVVDAAMGCSVSC